jgi:hypothetical protein
VKGINDENEFVTINAFISRKDIINDSLKISKALAVIVFQGYEEYRINNIQDEYKRNIILMSYLFLN